MSHKKLITDNLLVLIGGNIGNVFSFLTIIILLSFNKEVANLYVAYNSVVLILGVPALVSMRMFTVYGDSIIHKLKVRFLNNNTFFWILFAFLISTLPLSFIVKISIQDGNFITSYLLIILAFSTFLTYSFRGLKQFEDSYLKPIISLNIETLGRTLLVILFAIVFPFGIYGVLAGAIISMLLSIIPCYESNYFKNKTHEVSDYKLKSAFTNSLILTAGTEFFSNFDIAYSFRVLANNPQAQTEFNVLQIFRKIIFYGLFFSSGLFLSLGSKAKFSKKFTFFYTLGISLGFGIIGAIISYFLKDIFLKVLNSKFEILNGNDVLYFLIFTALMSAAYILSNWLLSLKKQIYIYIPGIASILQVFIFVFSQHNIHALILSFSITSGIFFALTVFAGIYEVFIKKESND